MIMTDNVLTLANLMSAMSDHH